MMTTVAVCCCVSVCVCVQVVDIMRVNVDKVLERDQKLSELDDRAGSPSTLLTSAHTHHSMFNWGNAPPVFVNLYYVMEIII